MTVEPRLLLAAPLAAALLLPVVLLVLPGCGSEAPAPERTLLLTGFGPFGGYETNPAWESIRELDGREIAGLRVRTARLDVTYGTAEAQLGEAIRATGADLVLCLGVAPDDALRLETTARNRDEANAADNAGVVHSGVAIRADGPATIPSRLPLETMRARLAAAGYEVRTSDDAGGYLCNHVFYRLMDGLAPAGAAGFVHVPTLGRSWDLERLKGAVLLLIETLGAPGPQGPTSP
jgi:pyroglutamyl-peptidase